MAGIAVRIALQVILVLRFGLPEITDRLDVRHHLARPQAGGVDVGDGLFGDPFLGVVLVVDRRAVARADIVALAVRRRRVVDLEEQFQVKYGN